MIAHLVLFKLKPEMSKMDPRVEAVIADMDALPQHVSVISAWEHGLNQTHDALAYDYGLHALFDNEDDLHTYFDLAASRRVAAMGGDQRPRFL